MAPYGGFSAVNLFWPPLQRRLRRCQVVDARSAKNVRGDPATLASTFSMGVRSSSTQIDRPCVASTRSFSRDWISMSSTGTVGRLFFRAVQFPPRSHDTQSPNSVPANKRFMFRGCSRTTCTLPAESRSEEHTSELQSLRHLV